MKHSKCKQSHLFAGIPQRIPRDAVRHDSAWPQACEIDFDNIDRRALILTGSRDVTTSRLVDRYYWNLIDYFSGSGQ
jgi:hypothetical protein